MARTELLRRVGGFDERLYCLEDWDLWIRLALAADSAACPDPLVAYVEHRGSILLAEGWEIGALDYLASKHERLARQLGVRFDRRGYAEWVARGDRRAGRRLRASRLYLRDAVAHGSPRSLARALGVLLGERSMRSMSRLVGRSGRGPSAEPVTIEAPAWLERYR